MTRDNTKTLQWLRANTKHTHSGIAGPCHDWTCDEFLDAIGGLLAANEALRFENDCLHKEVADFTAGKHELQIVKADITTAERQLLSALGRKSVTRVEYVPPKKKAKK